jgi:putative inorganic carbon (HCO3(-)) transporter
VGKIILYILLAGTSITSLFKPWIGVVASYLIILLGPQAIWFWVFEGLRSIFFITVSTVIGVIMAILQGRLDLAPLKERRNLFVAGLWLFICLSYFFGPFVDVSENRFYSPGDVFSICNKIFFFYFIAVICINSENSLKILSLAIVVAVIYLTYWINDQYLFQGRFGRIGGPEDMYHMGLYRDENMFAMLFVTGLPFLYYLGLYMKKLVYRIGLWLIIPLGWHAIFLTGSRGGLIGLVVTIILIAFRSKRKALTILVIPIFIVAYQWQAGDLMKERANTIGEYEQESSAQTRFNAWGIAIKMMSDNPLFGVGLGSFGTAFRNYSTYEKPREAHNTFFQISAESGIFAGTMYLLIIASVVFGTWRRSKTLRSPPKDDDQDIKFLFLLNEAVLISFIGLSVCALFLSLQLYEIFYFLCVLNSALASISEKKTFQHGLLTEGN